MLSVKLIDDYIIKSQDIKTFQIQLLRDGKPHAIPTDCTVTLLIANAKSIVKEEEMEVVDAEQGIVQFTLHATIGTGSFDCEFVLSNEDDINLTFPDNGFTVLKISECLTERPIQVITPSEYEKLNKKIDDLVLGDIDVNLEGYVTDDELAVAISEIDVTDQISTKQDKLVSGTNIKTVNGQSLLGKGNITIEGGANVDLDGYVTDDELAKAISEIEGGTYIHIGTSAPSDTSMLWIDTDDSSENSGSNDSVDLSNYVTQTDLNEALENIDVTDQLTTKQDKLVSGTNIKTVNGQSILGSGNITIEVGTEIEVATEEDEVYLLSILEGSGTISTAYVLDSEGNQLLDSDGNILIIKEG